MQPGSVQAMIWPRARPPVLLAVAPRIFAAFGAPADDAREGVEVAEPTTFDGAGKAYSSAVSTAGKDGVLWIETGPVWERVAP